MTQLAVTNSHTFDCGSFSILYTKVRSTVQLKLLLYKNEFASVMENTARRATRVARASRLFLSGNFLCRQRGIPPRGGGLSP